VITVVFIFKPSNVPPDARYTVTAKAALALHNLIRDNGKVYALNDLLAALWTESAIALMSRAVANVDVL
jgi:hypothetical protein